MSGHRRVAGGAEAGQARALGQRARARGGIVERGQLSAQRGASSTRALERQDRPARPRARRRPGSRARTLAGTSPRRCRPAAARIDRRRSRSPRACAAACPRCRESARRRGRAAAPAASARRRGLAVPTTAPGRSVSQRRGPARRRGRRARPRARERGEDEAPRELGRQVLGLWTAQSIAPLRSISSISHEQPFPDRRQVDLLPAITLGSHRHDLDLLSRAGEILGDAARLRERELTSPRADPGHCNGVRCSGDREAGSDRGWPETDAAWLRSAVNPSAWLRSVVSPSGRPGLQSSRLGGSDTPDQSGHVLRSFRPRPRPKSSWTSSSQERGEPAREDSRSLVIGACRILFTIAVDIASSAAPLLGRGLGQPGERPLHLAHADRLEPLAQGHDRRNHLDVAQPDEELARPRARRAPRPGAPRGRARAGSRRRPASGRRCRSGTRRRAVSTACSTSRGNGDVDEEQRPSAAPVHDPARRWRGVITGSVAPVEVDHDVHARQRGRQLVPRHRRAAQGPRQILGPRPGAVGHVDRETPPARPGAGPRARSSCRPPPGAPRGRPGPAKIFLASSTAANDTETACRAISVSVRTRLATLKAWLNSVCSCGPTVSHDWASAKASFTWPRIWGSPIIIESRLAATRNA